MSAIAQVLATIGPKIIEYGKGAISSFMGKMAQQGDEKSQVQPAPQPEPQQSGGSKFYYPSSGYTGIAGVIKKLSEQGKQVGGNFGNGGQ